MRRDACARIITLYFFNYCLLLFYMGNFCWQHIFKTVRDVDCIFCFFGITPSLFLVIFTKFSHDKYLLMLYLIYCGVLCMVIFKRNIANTCHIKFCLNFLQVRRHIQVAEFCILVSLI